MKPICHSCGSENVVYEGEYADPPSGWSAYAWYNCLDCNTDFVAPKPVEETMNDHADTER